MEPHASNATRQNHGARDRLRRHEGHEADQQPSDQQRCHRSGIDSIAPAVPSVCGDHTQNERAGLSNYHSLQGKFERRFSNGLTAISSYTWSHSIECCGGIRDASNLFWEKSSSNFDVRHRQVNSFSYDLPFGRSATGPLEKFIRGWQLAGIVTFQTGNPFTPSVSGDVANVGDSSSRPEQDCRWNASARRTDSFEMV